tara:strand:- start:811 stop:1749 length:939 start_codon:yes stop_codon:yes gene_type:complete
MKVNSIDFVLSNKIDLENKIYLISGNEPTLIEKIKNEIIVLYKGSGYGGQLNIKDLKQIYNGAELFEDKKIYILESFPNLKEEELEGLLAYEDVFIFVSTNSPKTNKIKKNFQNNPNRVLFDCYELSKEDKTKILNNFLIKNNMKLNDTYYWMIIEMLDNKYLFLEKELDKLRFLKKNNFNEKEISKIFSRNLNGVDKIFFDLMKKNKALVKIYNDRVTNQQELNDFYYFFRQFCFMLINHNNEDNFVKNIPKYLFREKSYLIDLFRKYNLNKKKRLLNLLYKTEVGIRKNGSLSVILGLRFLLSFKKITIS